MCALVGEGVTFAILACELPKICISKIQCLLVILNYKSMKSILLVTWFNI